jgi:cell wall-associated NlpC family hydrolase
MDQMVMIPAGTLCRNVAAAAMVAMLLQACASAPSPVESPPLNGVALPPADSIQPAPLPPPQTAAGTSLGSEVVIRAIAMVGVPYRFGGSNPDGFDCSGLVQYVYEELGIEVPRTAAEQYRAAEPVKLENIEPGDLLFFRTHGKRISHVAIYAGSGRFVHAPQTGRLIELRSLDDDYYRPRLAGVGRLF